MVSSAWKRIPRNAGKAQGFLRQRDAILPNQDQGLQLVPQVQPVKFARKAPHQEAQQGAGTRSGSTVPRDGNIEETADGRWEVRLADLPSGTSAKSLRAFLGDEVEHSSVRLDAEAGQAVIALATKASAESCLRRWEGFAAAMGSVPKRRGSSWAGHEACADFHVSLPAASLKRGLPVPPLMLEPDAAPVRRSQSEARDVERASLEVDQKQLQKERVAKARHTITQDRVRQARSQSRRVSASGGERLEFESVLVSFVESDVFELSIGLVIIFSTVTMTLEVDQVDLPMLINFSESFLTAFFLQESRPAPKFLPEKSAGSLTGEWITRVAVYGLPWFRSMENLLDTFIVWVPGVLTVWFLQPIFAGSADFLTPSLPVMQDLWQLVRGLLKSGGTLASAMTLIVFTLFVFGIAAVDLIARADYSGAEEDSKVAQSRFFGLWFAMLTLTRFMHGDDAQGIMDELTAHQPYIWIFLWTFAACASFVLLNLVTAIICNEAFETSKADEADLARQLKLQKEQEMREFKDVDRVDNFGHGYAISDLCDMFIELDEDGSGQVTLDEFTNAFEIDSVRNKLIVMGLTEDALLQLFTLLDTETWMHFGDGEGELSLDEFMGGMQSLSGLANAKDMVILTKGLERIEKQVSLLFQGSLSSGLPTQEMLQSQMTQVRVKIDDRFRKTETSLKDVVRFAKEADRPGMPMPTALAADREPKDLTNRLQRISGSSQAATHKGTAKVKAKKKVVKMPKASIMTSSSGEGDERI
eukprot:s162_g24.t1